jgi:HAD superfamily hydrolase (TIGR01484 family)
LGEGMPESSIWYNFPMNKYKAIISDIDGTLIPDDPHAIPTQRVKNAIKSVQEKGVTFILATGRPMSMLHYFLEELDYHGLLILDNGAVIYDVKNREKLIEYYLDSSEAISIVKIAYEYSQKLGISTNKGRVDNIHEVTKEMRIYKLCIIGLREQQAEEFIVKIQKQFTKVIVTRASSYKGKDFLDVYVSNAEATKQHAVLSVAELLNISPDDIVGIGDHYNDFPLLMACGLKVAIGNAVEDLKAIADYIAPPVSEDGAVVAIEKFFS